MNQYIKRYLDGLGSIVDLTDSTSSKVNSYDYYAYGVMLNQTEGVTNPWKFAGGYLDASGYYQFGVRYYDPSLGRWTQQDPVAGSLFELNSGNRYTYVEDDPVNKVDPSGKCDYLTAAILVVGILAAGFLLIALTPEGIPSAALIITALTTPVTAATAPVLAFLGTLLGFIAAAASALQCAATLGS